MTSLLHDEDPEMPTVFHFAGGPVRTEGFTGDPAKTTTCCGMCKLPSRVDENRLCRSCALNAAEIAAYTEDMRRWERNEQLFNMARELRGAIGRLESAEYDSKRSPARLTALRAAGIAMAEVVAQLHRAGGV